MEGKRQIMSRMKMIGMNNRITAEEFRSHIEEDDFFRRFGNPVFIIREEEPELVCMAWEYYERLLSKIAVDEERAD